jgi:hypothetical protein
MICRKRLQCLAAMMVGVSTMQFVTDVNAKAPAKKMTRWPMSRSVADSDSAPAIISRPIINQPGQVDPAAPQPIVTLATAADLNRPPDRESAEPTRRSHGLSGFAPIGQLTASGSVGSTPTGTEVIEADRPDHPIPDVETVRSRPGAEPWPSFGSLSTSSTSWHQPLYFADTNLERYGTSKYPRIQPLCSAAHFSASAIALPYQMATQHPGRTYRYSHPHEAGRYGYYERTLHPLDGQASLVQSAAVIGLIIAIP